jgi:hypothetical protein
VRHHAIVFMPFILGMLSMPVQAAPTESEIAILAQRICAIQGTSEKDYEEVFIQEMGGWLNKGSLTVAEIESETIYDSLGEQTANQMMQLCPDKLIEMNEANLFSNSPNNQ